MNLPHDISILSITRRMIKELTLDRIGKDTKIKFIAFLMTFDRKRMEKRSI